MRSRYAAESTFVGRMHSLARSIATVQRIGDAYRGCSVVIMSSKQRALQQQNTQRAEFTNSCAVILLICIMYDVVIMQ